MILSLKILPHLKCVATLVYTAREHGQCVQGLKDTFGPFAPGYYPFQGQGPR